MSRRPTKAGRPHHPHKGTATPLRPPASTARWTATMWLLCAAWLAGWAGAVWWVTAVVRGRFERGLLGLPYAGLTAELLGLLAYGLAVASLCGWLRRREIRNPAGHAPTVLPRVSSYLWRACTLTGLAHGFLVLPAIVVMTVVGAALPAAEMADDGPYTKAMQWLGARFFIGIVAGPGAAFVTGLLPLFVLWVVAAVHLNRSGAASRNLFIDLSLRSLAFVILLAIAALVVLPDVLPHGVLRGAMTAAAGVVLCGACGAAVMIGWRLGARPWFLPLRGGPSWAPSSRFTAWAVLAVRLVLGGALLWWVVNTVLAAAH